jgi:hypothetical protein
MKNSAAANLAFEGTELTQLASELRDAYEHLDGLCSELSNGGIVQARDIEPAIAQAVPMLRLAASMLETFNLIGDGPQVTSPRAGAGGGAGSKTVSQNPLLI